MEYDVKKEAKRQFLKYFKAWFVVVGAFAAVAVVLTGIRLVISATVAERVNMEAPEERVYDYADVLTDEEEQLLREHIAQKEKLIQADIVLVTTNEVMETAESTWEDAMMNYADDFYDENLYGFDQVHGNGVLLLDNWYDGQAGSWLSTCGSAYETLDDDDVNSILESVYYSIEESVFDAYMDYVDTTVMLMRPITGNPDGPFSIVFIILLPLIIAYRYARKRQKPEKAEKTTRNDTYMAGEPVMRAKRDDFLRKHIVTRIIDTDDDRSGGGSGGSGGGGHTSSSGVDHGGGGMRR